MENPWNDIPLDIYEAHMSLSNVAQIQALNVLTQKQMLAHPDAQSVAIIGVAGGNGLEYCGERFKAVYGIDVNPSYLHICAQRFRPVLGEKLRLIEMDLRNPESALPEADLIIANLLIEYVGVGTFCEKAANTQARYVSCVIHDSDTEHQFVSDSPYQTAFHAVGRLHCDVDEIELTDVMSRHGYYSEYREIVGLPNGKRLIRHDYRLER